MSFRLWALAVSAFVVSSALARGASADGPTLAGSWSAGPMSETVKIESWVDECGPKPKSGASGGGSYKVTQSGDELVFSGSPSFRTDQCWDMGLARRVSHSATPAIRWWKTRCESPPGDPRKAAITTVVRATDDNTIVLSESAQYSSTLSSGTCSASVERSRTFKIVSREGEAPAASTTASTTAAPAPTPTPTTPPQPPPPSVSCDSVGDPATLEVRPRRKILRPGESFDFKARLLDAKGCELSSKPTFRLAPESSSLTTVVVDPNGKVSAHADAEPGVVQIVAEASSKTAKVELEVVSDQKYAELLAAGGAALDAGDDQAVSVVVSTGGGSASTVRDPNVKEGARRRFAYVAIAGGICTLLALAALVLWRRGNAQHAKEEAQRASRKGKRAPVEPVRATPPPATPTPLAAAGAMPQPVAPTAIGVAGAPRMCPTCGTVPPAEAEFCPNDGTRLPGAKSASGPTATAALPTGKICPSCGRKYERDARFCSKDGLELVPLN